MRLAIIILSISFVGCISRYDGPCNSIRCVESRATYPLSETIYNGEGQPLVRISINPNGSPDWWAYADWDSNPSDRFLWWIRDGYPRDVIYYHCTAIEAALLWNWMLAQSHSETNPLIFRWPMDRRRHDT